MRGVGQCLCGKVKVTTEKVSSNLGACHCSFCRKWGGGPLMAVDCGTDVTFQGEENITVYDSSEWGARGFCNQCGTHLFFKVKAKGLYILPVSLLDSSHEYTFGHQIFIDEKPAYYDFANPTENLTGAEFFAKFAGK